MIFFTQLFSSDLLFFQSLTTSKLPNHGEFGILELSVATNQLRIFGSKNRSQESVFNMAAAKAEPAKRSNMVPVVPTERSNGFLFVSADGGCMRKAGS
jgi:hypothetical protein